jgi:ankyrin repeat protein
MLMVERPVPATLRGTWQGTIASGDVAAVRTFLDGPHEEADEQGRTLLHIAAIHGRKAIVLLLLERGADPEASDANGATPLHGAALRTHWIPPGARHGMRLYEACGYEHGVIAEVLLGAGADPRARDANGDTPLHDAAKGGNLAVARLLLANGADVHARNEYGSTPLHEAARGGNWEPGLHGFRVPGDHAAVAQLLIERGAAVDAPSITGTPLSNAIRSRAPELERLLLAAGADPTAEADGSMVVSPAHSAALDGNVALLQSLLDGGVDVNRATSSGRTLLHMAALGGGLEAVRLLVGRGARLDARDDAGQTPLHAAAEGGSITALRLLADKGGDLAATADDGTTLLHAAAGGCRAGEDMLEYLLDHGVPINAKTKDGRTALRIADESDCLIGNSPMTAGLRRRGGVR